MPGPHPLLRNEMLPVEIVLAPAWWHRHEGITFDEDFFFHPAKRVEAERRMEQALYQRRGRFGLGADHDKSLPMVGPVHLAAGFLLSEMLGCKIEYAADGPPTVRPANRENLDISTEAAFRSPAYRRWESLCDAPASQTWRSAGRCELERRLESRPRSPRPGPLFRHARQARPVDSRLRAKLPR